MVRPSWRFFCISVILGTATPSSHCQIADSIVSSLSTINDVNHKVDTLNKLGFDLIFTDPSEARSLFNEAISLSEKTAYREGHAKALKNKAISYDIQGNSNEAIGYYHESLIILESLQDTLGISRLKNNLGIAYKNLDDIETARKFYEESVDLKKSLGDIKGMAYGYNNIGELYEAQGAFTKALDFFTRANVTLDSLGDDHGNSITLSNIGVSHIELGNYSVAIEYILRSLKIDEKLQDYFSLSYSHLLLARANLHNHKISKGLEAVKMAEKMALDIGALKVYYESQIIKAQLLRSSGNLEELPDLYEKIIYLKDSLAHINLVEETAKMKGLYESQKKERMIAGLKDEAIFNKKLFVAQKNLFTISLIAVFLLVGLLIAVFILYQKGVRKKRLLEIRAMELDLAREKAEIANKTKSDFLANMSHEIRTPLNAIIGYTDQAMETSLEKTRMSYLRTVSQSANGLLEIINEVLEFSKLEAKELELRIDDTDLIELCEHVIRMLSYKAIEKKLVLKLSQVDIKYRYIRADITRFRQVLVNLLSNAIKFTEEGEVELKVEVLEEIDDRKTLFKFSVRDTGIGIKNENQENIFKAFSQEDSSLTRKYSGTGLGLSISTSLLSLMGSRLSVMSTPGKGSTFFFEVTFENATESFKNSSAQVLENQEQWHVIEDELTVLVVEDNQTNMLLAKLMIKKTLPNTRILEATNGLEAVSLFVKDKPDLIFMDIQMPYLDGYGATIEIRKIETGKRTPICALTAGFSDIEKEKCFEAGMDDFISKPIPKNAISQVISKWVINKSL
jgi:signal transduction histidine kinase